MVEPVLELVGVKKIIDKQTIVSEVNMKLLPGEALALCGANGAGKSTVLRMIAGIMQPTEGLIRVKGLRWKEDRRAYARQIGYMPDDFRFGNGLSARETLAFWSALRDLPQRRAEEALAEVGLTDVGARPVSSFSKGMRQRVLFAQAMLAHPPLLLLDEPTNGLDPYWMDTFVGLVHSLKKSGHAVVFSTHQLRIAEALADRAAFMSGGRVLLEGSVGSIRERLGAEGLEDAFAGLFTGENNVKQSYMKRFMP